MDPPIKQGQTRYPFVICLFDKDNTQDITLEMTEAELKDKYEGRLQKYITGPTFEVVSRLMKAVTGRKITVPGSYKSDQGNNCVSCSYKAQNGVLFPLERGFMYLHKPPIYTRFDEIDNVNFARESSKLRSFEFHIETKQGQKQVFGTIDRAEYAKLFDFVKEHNLKIRNIKGQGNAEDHNLGSSSDDENPDYYRNVITNELETNIDDGDDDDSSTDEDFDPDAADPEAKEGGDEEYDSDAADRSTDSEDRDGMATGEEDGEGGDKPPKEKKLKKKKERKRKPSGGDGEKAPRKRKEKKPKIGPKRAMSAYFFFLADERETIKKDNPDIKVTDVSKVAGQRWKEISAERKAKYDEMAKNDRERYDRERKEFIDGGGQLPTATKSKSASKAAKPSKKQSPIRSPIKAVKSAETIEDSDSDDSD